ncbi:MAG: glycerol-3-phosphate 1-O-acyltransferase PlsY [Gammaproteobacteria bacterium]|nr:glycerol-3-phosphate 1-O-acyltransferase PlsY [Gammaproteobacteria bacterium]MBI5618952.1 glycerol-3-phosphate 1-O-acyltransferase PlsY [Gammaproteobacteria bacterium]
MLLALIALVAAYLLGSLSAAILVCHLCGFGDPRTVGSGNPGATNVLRAFGKAAAAATLAGDVAKGVVPVLIAKLVGAAPLVVAGVGVAAFLGHLFPIFFGFRGGKGVATLIGVLFGIEWRLGAAFIATWLAVAALTRYSSLSALVASLLAPAVALWLGQPPAVGLVLLGMTSLVFWRHESNIRKLLAGTESRISRKKSA